MHADYQARWVSKPRADVIKKSRSLGQAMLLDTINGFLIVEPAGEPLGDGPVLSRQEADYELHPAWYTGPVAKLREARKRLGLESAAPAGQMAGA